MIDETPADERTSATVPAGWYPNPSGAPGIRYFDGSEWTPFHRPDPPEPAAAPLPTWPPAHPAGYSGHPPDTLIVTGPNHVLHAVLTLLTFWACGGWAWIWLIVAISNRRRVHVVPTPVPPRR